MIQKFDQARKEKKLKSELQAAANKIKIDQFHLDENRVGSR